MSANTHRPRIMGILNMTPDSFSDGGTHHDPAAGLHHALTMVEEGADMIDVGGESTRPGSLPVPAHEQIARILPVLRLLSAQPPFQSGAVSISVDTTRSEVAEAAVAAGASLINDVSAGTDDDRMLPLLARLGADVVLMHKQGSPASMQDRPHYTDVVTEVCDYLQQRVSAALDAGIKPQRIMLDPGIGFGKLTRHNLQLLAELDRIVGLGFPVLLGCSRKRFMGAICRETSPADLVGATVATTLLGLMAGVQVLRVHDVKANRQALDVALAVMAETAE